MKKLPLFFLLCVALSLLFVGCSRNDEHEAARLVLREGDHQCGPLGAKLPLNLVIEVFGPMRATTFGNESSRPASEVEVLIEPLHSNGGAVEPMRGKTDSGGVFRCELQLGNSFGDQYFKVSCPDFLHVTPLLVHAVAGIEISGNEQEVLAGNELPKPIVIQVKDANGVVAGLPVFVRQTGGSREAKGPGRQFLTDANGTVNLTVQTASGFTGKYEYVLDIGDGYAYKDTGMVSAEATPEYRSRGLKLCVLAVSRWNIIIGVLGGLGLFIFGMTLMSNGLQQMAGDRFKSLLQLFAGSKFKAVLAGVVVTSLIQSSSATTVMVVGFVNAGLLLLDQAIGIIYGAAIGTTVTAQMVSFKLDGLALPAICIGVVMLLMAKNRNQLLGIGNIILGFGLLFFGMMLMSSEMKVLADFPSFMAFFKMFDCAPRNGYMPFGCVLGAIAVGTVLTMIVQSSAATVGMTMALAECGLINFYTAVPLILGDNIGTTITGLLACIGTSRPSRQTAVAATIFKTLGVLIMIPLFYVKINGQPIFLELVDVVTAGVVLCAHPENIGRHLASAHTLFNLIGVIVFLPFTGFVAMLSKLIVPENKDDESKRNHLVFLETHLLNMPSAALDQVLTSLVTMTREAVKLTNDATEAFLRGQGQLGGELRQRENRIDEAQKDIIDYLVRLTRRNLSESQSATIPIFMHCVNDVERIGDRAINIFDLTASMPTVDNGLIDLHASASEEEIAAESKLSDYAIGEIREILSQISSMAAELLTGMTKNDEESFNRVIKQQGEIKGLTSRFERNHEARLKTQNCTVQKGIVFVEILANMERITAHLTNLAERARDMSKHKILEQNHE